MEIKSKTLKKAINNLENTNIASIMKQFSIINQDIKTIQDVQPSDLMLDSIIQITQETEQKKQKKAQFVVCDKWLKPANVFSIIAKSKQKKDNNVWVLFYDSNIWYIRKGLRAAVNVHVKLISNPEKNEK